MKRVLLSFLLALPFFLSAQLKYPATKKVNQVDGYHGQAKVEDPYRWLEDDNSADTKAWVKDENKVTFDYLSTIPIREQVRKRLETLWNYTRYASPFKKGQYYYYWKNDGLQNQSVLYRQLGIVGKPEVFLDPNKLSKEGIAAIGNYGFSKSGKYFGYTVAVAGSDWQEGYIMETATKKLLSEKIEWIKFGGFDWKNDEGFYYSGYEKPADENSKLTKTNEFNIVKYHELNTAQSADKLVYVDLEHPLRYHSAGLTEDGRFLILNVSQGTSGSELYFMDNKDQSMVRFELLVPGFESDSYVIDNKGDKLLVMTNEDAPNFKVVAIKARTPREREEEEKERREKNKITRRETEEEMKQEMKEQWVTVIPEKDMALQSVSTGGGYLFASYLKDASTRVYQYTYDGKLVREIKLPGLGTASGFSGEKKDNEVFYSFTSFNSPLTIYRYNLATGVSTLFRKPEVKVKTDDLVTEQVFFKSKDGTKVPMFLTYKKGIVKNGQNPVLMYGYGGFNIPVTPSFSVSNAFFMEQGGIYASVNLRGGSEYGEKWHKEGMRLACLGLL